jgi:hypothetical protein
VYCCDVFLSCSKEVKVVDTFPILDSHSGSLVLHSSEKPATPHYLSYRRMITNELKHVAIELCNPEKLEVEK